MRTTLPDISKPLLLRMCQTMILIRRFEEKIIGVYGLQDMKSPVHLCIGQEAISAGVCCNLRPDDYLFTNHRGHGHCLAKGMEPRVLYAEFYGRANGCASGKGGSMHPVAPELGILGTSAIVGGGIPLAVGAALAAKMRNSSRVSVVFFGDGATDEGTFHEGLNFSSLKRLPVIFVCENNFYAVNSHLSARQPDDNLVRYAASYGMPGVQIRSGDVIEVYAAALEAVNRARSGMGPTLLECRTYRWLGHVGPECDYPKGCRPKDELEEWMERCPVESFKELLIRLEITTKRELESLVSQIDSDLDEALSWAQNSPLPRPEEVFDHVYCAGR